MNTEELAQFMLEDSSIRKVYGGVLPKDYLPIETKPPQLFIVNCDESSEKGSHWVVVYLVNKSSAEYFDPLGAIPSTDFVKYLLSQSDDIRINLKQCQSTTSSSCG